LAAQVGRLQRLRARRCALQLAQALELRAQFAGRLADVLAQQQRRLRLQRHREQPALRLHPLDQLALERAARAIPRLVVEVAELEQRAALGRVLEHARALVDLLRLEHETGAGLELRQRLREGRRVAAQPAVGAADDHERALAEQAAAAQQL